MTCQGTWFRDLRAMALEPDFGKVQSFEDQCECIADGRGCGGMCYQAVPLRCHAHSSFRARHFQWWQSVTCIVRLGSSISTCFHFRMSARCGVFAVSVRRGCYAGLAFPQLVCRPCMEPCLYPGFVSSEGTGWSIARTSVYVRKFFPVTLFSPFGFCVSLQAVALQLPPCIARNLSLGFRFIDWMLVLCNSAATSAQRGRACVDMR